MVIHDAVDDNLVARHDPHRVTAFGEYFRQRRSEAARTQHTDRLAHRGLHIVVTAAQQDEHGPCLPTSSSVKLASMSVGLSVFDAQVALAPLAMAVEALCAGHVVDVEPLLAAVRATPIAGYPGAAADVVDVPAILEVLSRHPHVAEHEQHIDDGVLWLTAADDDHTPRRHRGSRLLVDAIVLALESRKLQWGQRPEPAALKANFASPDDARALLSRLIALPALRLQPVHENNVVVARNPPTVGADRVVHVVVGHAAQRLFDMLSPAVRHLRVDLALLGRRNGRIDDDDVYRGLAHVDAHDPTCRSERNTADASMSVRAHSDHFVVDTTVLQEDLVDRRLRSLLAPLKKQRAVIVGVLDDDALPAVLWLHPRTLQVVSTCNAPTSSSPTLLDAASGHVWPGADGLSLSLPSPVLFPVSAPFVVDDSAFWLVQSAARAATERSTALPVVKLGDEASTVCAASVAAMVPV